MQQLTQQLRSGQIEIRELPMPQVGSGMVQVRNHFSLISAGTEGSTVKTARKSLLGKAKERPQQVKQVIDTLKQQGPVATYRAVMKKLEAYSPLGYSSAGVVIDVGEGVRGFRVGDKVACAGGGYASHAEVVSCPENLCVRLEDEADLKLAAFNTLGAIAMQGLRQADPRLGEACAVIGLGLLGQLTCLLLRAAGVRVFGIDVDPEAVKNAAAHCADRAWVREDAGIEEEVLRATGGIGVDAVIITAATSSLDPVNFAGALCRAKGRVVVVGDVPTGFDRAPHYYNKELDLRMSCSYGPGRYDPDYEEKGIDYPVGYVRWTEKRNMQAFQELVQGGRVDIGHLLTHEFELERAAEAYDMILSRSEPFMGVLLRYDTEREIEGGLIRVREAGRDPMDGLGLAFIGAGSYAQGNLLPHLPKGERIRRRSILTSSGATSRRVADQFGFEACTDREDDIFEDADTNVVFIATRHDTHGGYVKKALERNKNTFVEKPLCLTGEELAEIEAQYAGLAESGNAPLLMVGFNRRFSPLSRELRGKLGDSPVSMLYRVNAGSVAADSWIQDPEVGGGRIIGEVCHFIDYATFVAGSLPARVFASRVPDPFGHDDTVAINLEFTNGSIASILYFANGDRSLAKEYVEVFQAGTCAVIRDFRELEFHGRRPQKKRLLAQDKGQKHMIGAVFDSLENGKPAPITAAETFAVHRATFAVLESLKSGLPCELPV
jgi:predicted dehydrogenase/threonine dehydrogenase-like Zn-dependent dehydrogenase